MKKLIIKTKRRKELVDITNNVGKVLAGGEIREGLCHLFLPHSTVGLTTAYLNPGAELDLIDAFDVMIPHLVDPTKKYEHSHVRGHLPDHIIASFLGPSLAIPVHKGKLLLGDYQRVVLVELNGPKKREIMISIVELYEEHPMMKTLPKVFKVKKNGEDFISYDEP